MVEGLTRAQRSRLEDQRGTEINFDMPDFLKDNDKERVPRKPPRAALHSTNNTHSHLHEGKQSDNIGKKPACYENRHILSKDFDNLTTNKLNNLRTYSNKLKPIEIRENVAIISQNVQISPKIEPPPLPPKPKIIPIKPANWGQSAFYNRSREVVVDTNNQLYLEQPSSSFV